MPDELRVETDELSELSRNIDRCYRNVCSSYKRDINSIKREMENIISRYSDYGSVVSSARGILSSLKDIEHKMGSVEEHSQRLVTNTKQAATLYKESEYMSKGVLDKGRLSVGKTIKFPGSIGSSNISFKASNELGEKSQEWEEEFLLIGGNQAEKFTRSESDIAYLEGGILYESIDGKIYKNGELVAEKDYKYIPHEVGGLRTTDGNGTFARAYVENKTVYEQIGKQIYKNGVLIPEENYKYVPKEIGGIRDTIGKGSYVIVSQTYVEGDTIYQRIGGIIYKNGKVITADDYKYIPVEIGGIREIEGNGNFAQGYKEGEYTYIKIGDIIYKNGKKVSKNDYKYVPQEIGGLRENVGGGNYITNELVDLVTSIGKEIGDTTLALEGEELADYWREKLAEEAKYWVGKIPYCIDSVITTQILDKNNAPPYMDCSDFTSSVYKTIFGIDIGPNCSTQVGRGKSVEKEELKIGDLIFFDTNGINNKQTTHVGIYIGNGQFVHEGGENSNPNTLKSGENVKIGDLNNSYWAPKYVKAVRIIQDDGNIINTTSTKLPSIIIENENTSTSNNVVQGTYNGLSDENEAIKRFLKITIKNEGKDKFYNVSNPGDGQAVSFGFNQWCIGQGSFQSLFKAYDKQYPGKLEKLIGQDMAKQLKNNVIYASTAEGTKWAKINMSAGEYGVNKKWTEALQKIGNDIDMQKVQTQKAINDAILPAINDLDSFGIELSDRFIYVMNDLRVQGGSLYPSVPRNIEGVNVKLDKEYYLSKINESMTSEEKLVQIVCARASGCNADWERNFAVRKIPYITGYGYTTYGEDKALRGNTRFYLNPDEILDKKLGAKLGYKNWESDLTRSMGFKDEVLNKQELIQALTVDNVWRILNEI